MMRLHLKKQICMEGGCMLNWSDIFIGVVMLMGGLFGIMLSFYLLLCFIQWIGDVVDEKRWNEWMEWFRYDS